MSLLGTPAEIDSALNNGSQAVTVETGAKLFVMGVSGYFATANWFSSAPPTLAGSAPSITVAGDGDTNFFMGALFLWRNPPTGSQTVAWDWPSTGTPVDGVVFGYASYSDDVQAAARDTFSVQHATGPHATDSMTAQSGDVVIAWGFGFVSAGTGTWTWINATERSEDQFGRASGSLADAFPSGNVIVTASETVDDADGGIVAAVLIPNVTTTLDQEGFRWRNDDGSETTATWKAAQDTNVSIAPDLTTRLRFIVNATSDPPSAQYKLQYRKSGAADWRDIDTDG